ncbi:uncharacterized protein L969DRAFT_50337 [Mixia osmundae IAM 14324]|uniref:glutathione transferase n=1 Tax=Mixia osmundae (strain CBS 9802 / IAM 14324 / JCM 22182 / KY 12970) TaxID=764103 RepID=G7E0Z4_MIXOS|nr:uncharacterized protein L969DRAFT_50337 [Mixia osmundae IAM 14324]KEI38861.1 hypothetical protein L969DRAFT_50337 [Mixia osmundae IAM 14324]GAA96504.1 hypothetical protein E5Q_03172 [Mixia osmundae IAM 14324]
MSGPKFTLHHLEKSRSTRIIWLLEELGLDYELTKYKRTSDMLAPPELAKIHPLGKAPVVTVTENGKTETLAESGAIIEYIIARYGKGKLAPKVEDSLYKDYLFWLHYTEGSVMSLIMMNLVFGQLPYQGPFLARPILHVVTAGARQQFLNPGLKNHFKFIDAELEKTGGKFLVGNSLTGADINFSFVVESVAAMGWINNYPNIKTYYASIKAHPAYKIAEEKGDPVDLSMFAK